MNTELLLCVACLNPNNSFSSFDKEKLIHLAQFYSCDFSSTEVMALDNQLETYIIDVCSNDQFSTIKGIGGFTQKFVQTKKNLAYPLVYLLVKLALILHVANASVEWAFSTMKTVKIQLQNWMGDQLFNDYLIIYVEKDAFDSIDNKAIMQRFQKMKTH
ncbi:hypothetical protein P3X46_022505 [Hevea brasiliensis]|uniref:HAT C-terminal dimerisation domain-containing protein n=1 Tax=Hevea brasiliensis TaxID=3981 RepID=A0ABQ9L819_HEVBR|nr:hypothetical protein P3X46_022505 [Hevea brasiliensis]